ncbi:MAG: hypothetical protein M1822_004289 [Bathelium mastoideum]|nr:MAG: hypothetical protein M1822_004289 [Bathelium mastoideum]
MSYDATELIAIHHPETVNPVPALRSLVQSASASRISDEQAHQQHDAQDVEVAVPKAMIASVISSVTVVAWLNAMVYGMVTVGLPTIAEDLRLSEGLLLWPAAIPSLTCGCTFLLSGSMVDVFGSRIMYLLGCFLQCIFILGCGLSKNAVQLLVFLGLTGIAISFCLPSAVSIITNTMPAGKLRNLAFGSMGGGRPVGFSIGLVLGGILSDTIGWRYGFYICAAINAVIVIVAIFGLPQDTRPSIPDTWSKRWEVIRRDVDWVGTLILSASLALMSYVLASITGSGTNIKEPANICLLAGALALIPMFILWAGRQERNNKPALIPNSLWRDRSFTSICIAVVLIWGSFNAAEIIISFFFQDVQLLTPTQSSVRFLPEPVAGVLINVINGLIIHRIHANWIVVIGIAVSSLAPLLMAICNPQWSYWACVFLVNCVLPAGSEGLFTVSNLVITSVFPSKTQGLAGGVFNTVSQVGKSVGLALAQVIAANITARSSYKNKSSPGALLEGYRAAFWYCFAVNVATLFVVVWGLRSIGKVGHKRD